MANVQQIGTQVMLLTKQLQMYGLQENEEKEDEIIETLQSVVEDLMENDDSTARYVISSTAAKAIHDAYDRRPDYVMACDTSITALRYLKPIIHCFDDERCVTMLTMQLMMAATDIAFFQPEDSGNPKAFNQLMQALLSLLVCELKILRRINPTSQAVNICDKAVRQLHDAGYDEEDPGSDIDRYYNHAIGLWDKLFNGADDDENEDENEDEKSDFLDFVKDGPISGNFTDMLSLFSNNRFESFDQTNPTDADKDKVLSPLYDDLKGRLDQDTLIDCLNREIKEDAEEGISDETDFLKAVFLFSEFYHDYCEHKGIHGEELADFYIEDMFPYCPMTQLHTIHSNFRQAYLSLAESFGTMKQALTEDIDNDDKMMDLAEKMPEDLQNLIVALISLNICAEGVEIHNDTLFKEAIKYHDETIAEDINALVDKLHENKIITSREHYDEDFVEDIMNRID